MANHGISTSDSTALEYPFILPNLALAYNTAFENVSGITPMIEAPWAFSSFWMYTILIDHKQFGMNSRSLIKLLLEKGIQARPLWQPAHLSPAHKDMFPTDCAVSEHLYQCALSLPCSVGLKDAEFERVVETVLNGYQQKVKS